MVIGLCSSGFQHRCERFTSSEAKRSISSRLGYSGSSSYNFVFHFHSTTGALQGLSVASS